MSNGRPMPLLPDHVTFLTDRLAQRTSLPVFNLSYTLCPPTLRHHTFDPSQSVAKFPGSSHPDSCDQRLPDRPTIHILGRRQSTKIPLLNVTRVAHDPSQVGPRSGPRLFRKDSEHIQVSSAYVFCFRRSVLRSTSPHVTLDFHWQ